MELAIIVLKLNLWIYGAFRGGGLVRGEGLLAYANNEHQKPSAYANRVNGASRQFGGLP